MLLRCMFCSLEPLAGGSGKAWANWRHGASIADINKQCLSEFRLHWKCLQNNNMELWHCRNEEMPFNACVFEKLVGDAEEHTCGASHTNALQKLTKVIPDTPKGETPIHLRSSTFK